MSWRIDMEDVGAQKWQISKKYTPCLGQRTGVSKIFASSIAISWGTAKRTVSRGPKGGRQGVSGGWGLFVWAQCGWNMFFSWQTFFFEPCLWICLVLLFFGPVLCVFAWELESSTRQAKIEQLEAQCREVWSSWWQRRVSWAFYMLLLWVFYMVFLWFLPGFIGFLMVLCWIYRVCGFTGYITLAGLAFPVSWVFGLSRLAFLGVGTYNHNYRQPLQAPLHKENWAVRWTHLCGICPTNESTLQTSKPDLTWKTSSKKGGSTHFTKVHKKDLKWNSQT